MSKSQQLSSLDSSTDGHSSSPVASWPRVTLGERNILEAMRVQDQGTVSGGTSHEIVAGVANDQTEVVDTSEVDGGLHMLSRLGENDVVTVETASASIGGRARESTTGIVRPIWPEVRYRVVGAKTQCQKPTSHRG